MERDKFMIHFSMRNSTVVGRKILAAAAILGGQSHDHQPQHHLGRIHAAPDAHARRLLEVMQRLHAVGTLATAVQTAARGCRAVVFVQGELTAVAGPWSRSSPAAPAPSLENESYELSSYFADTTPARYLDDRMK
jgi:hypothetical protein